MPPPEYGGGYGMPGGGRPGMPPGGMPYGYGNFCKFHLSLIFCFSGYPPAGGPGAGYPDPSFMPSPLDAEIQVVCREIHTELHTLEQSGEYGEQFKNARRLLTTGEY